MKKNIFLTVLFIVSLLLNFFFAAAFITASASGSALLSYQRPYENALTSAVVVSSPMDGYLFFSLAEIALKPGEKAHFQYIFKTGGGPQSSIVMRPLYDPEVISMRDTASGFEITALRPGFSVIQAVTTGGIKDIALVFVEG